MTNFYGGIPESQIPSGSGNGLFWTYGYPAPTAARYGHCLETNGTDIFMFGGQAGPLLSSCEKYNITNNSWSSITALSTTRKNSFSVINGNDIYVLGGYAGAIQAYNHKYSISGNSWDTSSLAALPVALYSAASAYWNGYIYVFGGLPTTTESTVVNTVYKYDIVGNSWSTMSASPMPTALCYHRAITINNEIYIIAGSAGSIASSELFKYTPSISGDGSWTALTSRPVASRWPAVANVGDYIYVLGGEMDGTSFTYSGNVNYRYSISTNTWERLLSFPTINVYASDTIVAPLRVQWHGVSINDKIWLPTGGVVSHSTYTSSFLRLNNC